jgi:hypothetical protein
MSSSYFIYKCVTPTGGDPCYWNDDVGEWSTEFSEATNFPKFILTTPLPPGATHIMEVHSSGKPLGTYALVAGEKQVFQKTY